MNFDVIVVGAGASGLFCAGQAGMRGKSVLVLDHNDRIGHKITLSGGGKCNFTNMEIDAKKNYICSNPYFPISALSRFSQWDFLDLIDKYGVAYEERGNGRLFCLNSAHDIVDLLHGEIQKSGDLVKVQLNTSINTIRKTETGFSVVTKEETYTADSVVIATGGLPLPRAGASGFGIDLADRMGHNIIPPMPGLVPFLSNDNDLSEMAGLSFTVRMNVGVVSFEEDMLITHRGLSGPVALQASNYWNKGEVISINLIPQIDLEQELRTGKADKQLRLVQRLLADYLPKRFVAFLINKYNLRNCRITQLDESDIMAIVSAVQNWQFKPVGTEHFLLAETTLGGVDTDEISSKTMESKKVKGLYFIGEVLDVAGHLGGYNFQWAWASGFCAAQFV